MSDYHLSFQITNINMIVIFLCNIFPCFVKSCIQSVPKFAIQYNIAEKSSRNEVIKILRFFIPNSFSDTRIILLKFYYIKVDPSYTKYTELMYSREGNCLNVFSD